MWSTWRTSIALFWSWSWSLTAIVNAQGNTTCKTNSLDWYTDSVGETPCQTYQRLRQICNSAYTVGSLSPATPPDTCDDQVAGCCCNSVSFALSMLCLNCQQGVGSGMNGDNGMDAGVGAYQGYIGKCTPNVNQSLPTDIQAAVCNDKIKIDDDLYGLFWSDGSWFYMYTRETIQKDQQTFANNTFTHCASTTTNNSTNTTSSSTSTATTATTSSTATGTTLPALLGSNHSPSSMSGGTIAGIAIGGAAVSLVLVAVLFFLLRRRRRSSSSPDKISSYTRPEMQQNTYQIEPFIPPSSNSISISNYTRPSVGLSDSNNASQTQLLPSGTSESSPRAQKGRAPVVLPPDRDNGPSARQSAPPSTSQSSTTTAPVSSSPRQSVEALPERHADGGPLMGRSPSGRLPPAYGEQRDEF